jgi:HlyD family secretion protein
MIEEAGNSNVRVKPKKTKKVKLLIAGGFLLSAILGYVSVVPAIQNWSESELSYSKDRVRTAKVTQGTFERSVASDGKIVAEIKPALFAPDDGRISLMVQPGNSVAEGDILTY